MNEADRVRANQIVETKSRLQKAKDELDGGSPFENIRFYGGDGSQDSSNGDVSLQKNDMQGHTGDETWLAGVIEDRRAALEAAINTKITDLDNELAAL